MGSRAAGRTRRVVATAVLAGCSVLTGCSAAGSPAPAPARPAPAPVAVPAGGVSLAELGFRHPPAGLVTLPAGVRVTRQIDQPNHLTATFAPADATEIGRWLRLHLADGGFTVTGYGDVAVLFAGAGWSGAFTAGGGESALTLRRDPT